MTFTHLQMRSGYSFYQSTMTIERMVQKAADNNVKALTLTDDGVLYGAITFYKACINQGIKPILGLIVTLKLSNDLHIPVTLLARNHSGYKGLMQISTKYQTTGTCTLNDVKRYVKDLVCIISADTPLIREQIGRQDIDNLLRNLQLFSNIFTQRQLYIGIEKYHSPLEEQEVKWFQKLGEQSTIQMVALQDVRYLEKQDIQSYECLQAMKEGNKWNGQLGHKNMMNHHFRTEEEMGSYFHLWPQLMTNIAQIIDLCDLKLNFDQTLLPAFPLPEGDTAHTYLERICQEQLSHKYPSPQLNMATKRLTYELSVIQQERFSDYFLIVADFIQYAKDNQIAVGPGRGSAAGSLVAYVLGITNVDPLKYGLLFERFLNPDRVTMPDIDIDFSDVRREEVIKYVTKKYGQTHVAQIITFGTFLARSLLRDIMKTMEIDHRDQAYILKHVPSGTNEKLIQIVKKSAEFQTYIKETDLLRKVFSIAFKLEGLPKHMSTHAAGIVIGKHELTEDVPLTNGSEGTYLTQYAMNDLEAIGLLKIDLLGLRNLTLMERVINSINKQKQLKLVPEAFPEDDRQTYQLLQNAMTNGVFQLESAGMKGVLRQLQPSTLDDIVAVNALYRPGPMEQIPTYINRKHGKEQVTFLHEDLRPILKSTYGVLIYQEQIMQIVHQFAGLSLGEADILRRAISKKDSQLIAEQRDNFIRGCVKKGYDKKIAEELFSWIDRFANYGFNKSHSVAYSKIAYQLSYLKAHYPTFFIAHMLSNVINDAKKLHLYMKEAKSLGIKILAPNINQSQAYFAVEKGQIRVGLMAIKGIGYDTVKTIINEREQRRFQDIFDFCLRVKLKRHLTETFIMAGAFDTTHHNRASMLASLDMAYDRAELFGDIRHGDLFQNDLKMNHHYVQTEDFTTMQKLADEKDLMQMYVSDHPLGKYRNNLAVKGMNTVQQAKLLDQNSQVTFIVLLQQVKKIHTKRGESMAFVTIGDETDDMEGVVFPALYREVNPILKEEALLHVKGKISVRNKQKQLILNEVNPYNMEELEDVVTNFIYIKVLKGMNKERVLLFLERLATSHPGSTGIILHHEENKQTFRLDKKYNIQPIAANVEKLKDYFGDKNVVFHS